MSNNEPDPVKDFLDAVDGPEDLFAYEMKFPPGWAAQAIKRDQASLIAMDITRQKVTEAIVSQLGIPKKIINP